MATTTQIQKQRIEYSYVIYLKRHPIENSSNKPPIEITKDSFFSKGAKLEVYITKVQNVYTDWYDYQINVVSNKAVESTSDKPTKTVKNTIYADTRIEREKADWERYESDSFERVLLYFKNEFDSRKFENEISLDFTLDQSIEDQYIPSEIIEWMFNKFLNSITITALTTNSNTIVLPNSQYNILRTVIYGFDVVVQNLCYIVSPGYVELSHVRLIHQSENANENSEISLETRFASLVNVEIHGLLKLNVLGIIDSEDNYSESQCTVNSVRYYIKDSQENSLKRNIFKIANFNNVIINSFVIPKNYPNSTFLHIMRSTNVSITNYQNTNITSSKSGSEIFCESISELSISDVSIISSIENNNYYFLSATKFKEGANISINDCNFVNVGLFDLLDESFGDVRISDCNIVSNKPINTMGKPIYNLQIDDVVLNCQEFIVNGVVTLNISDTTLTVAKNFDIKAEKLVIDDCLFNISGDFKASLEANASVTSSQSRIEDTGIECRGFKIESQEGFNKTLKYAQFKLYASTYEDSGIDKVIISEKTIIESNTYAFKSIKMISYTEEFYIRISDLKQSEDSLIIQSIFSGIMTFDLENSWNSKNINLQMINNTDTNEPVSATFIFDGISKVLDSKNFHLSSKNAFLDILLKTNNVKLLNVGLSIEGDNAFENGRVFYSGSDTVIYKFEKIEAAKLENTKFLELNTLPTKNKYIFQYGVIK